jgi:hypothetical protein
MFSLDFGIYAPAPPCSFVFFVVKGFVLPDHGDVGDHPLSASVISFWFSDHPITRDLPIPRSFSPPAWPFSSSVANKATSSNRRLRDPGVTLG